jgi:Uma2 family endonuclease
MGIALNEVLTLEQFLELPEVKPPLEFLQGRIEQKVSPTLAHSLLSKRLTHVLDDYAIPRRLGEAFPELRCSFGSESFVVDVCFFARGRLPLSDRGYPDEKVMLAPDLAIEVLSPGQTVAKLSARLSRCVRKGVRLGWLIQPRRRRAYAIAPGHPLRTLERGAALEGEAVLPGFRLPLDELFGWLEVTD